MATRQGSFLSAAPRCAVGGAGDVFLRMLDTPAQREALQEEILERIAAIQALSETVASAQLEAQTLARTAVFWMRSPISSRDVRGLMEASSSGTVSPRLPGRRYAVPAAGKSPSLRGDHSFLPQRMKAGFTMATAK